MNDLKPCPLCGRKVTFLITAHSGSRGLLVYHAGDTGIQPLFMGPYYDDSWVDAEPEEFVRRGTEEWNMYRERGMDYLRELSEREYGSARGFCDWKTGGL